MWGGRVKDKFVENKNCFALIAQDIILPEMYYVNSESCFNR